jgi:hypothetical protein
MKNLLVILAAAISIASCNQNDAKGSSVESANTAEAPESSSTTIQWVDSAQQDLGTIKEGQTPEISWRFKNTGDKPLVIENASGTCGCTIAEKPTEPIMPGEEGTIKAKFNSEGRPGPNTKQVVVLANTKGPKEHFLGFTVTVEKK